MSCNRLITPPPPPRDLLIHSILRGEKYAIFTKIFYSTRIRCSLISPQYRTKIISFDS